MHVLFPDYVVFDWVISYFISYMITSISLKCTCFGDLFYEEALTLSQQSHMLIASISGHDEYSFTKLFKWQTWSG